MDIRINSKKVLEKIKKIKDIENLKCSSKALDFLCDCYFEKIRIENELNKKKSL